MMLFKKSSKEKESGKETFTLLSIEAKAERLPSLLTRLISKIRNHGEQFLFLEAVAREGLNVLQAHRSTIFVLDEKNKAFAPHCSLSSEAKYEVLGDSLEREFASKMISFSQPGVVKSAGDFFKIIHRELIRGQITSLTSAPFYSNERPAGAILAVRFQERPPFNDFDHQVTSLLADLISLQMEDFFLHQEVERGVNLRKTYERYLDDLLAKLQTHFPVAVPVPEKTECPPSALPQPPSLPEQGKDDSGVEGIISLQEEDLRNRRQDERIDTVVRVEFEDHDLGLTDNLSRGGAFVRTLTPLDLGEEFSMLLHLGGGSEPLNVDCKVVWTNQFGSVTKELQRGMGIKFKNLSAEGQMRLSRFIQEQKDRQTAETLQGEKNVE